MKLKWQRLNRKIHYWGAIVCALPILVVLISGLLLQVKKQSDWIQPPTIKGHSAIPSLAMDEILSTVQQLPDIQLSSWEDIDRVDIRPDKGVIKVRGKNQWEVQLDQGSGEVLHVAYRRTDVIESLHDGSFFHDKSKLWLFLPAAIILTVLWMTGIYLFVITLLSRRRSKARKRAKASR